MLESPALITNYKQSRNSEAVNSSASAKIFYNYNIVIFLLTSHVQINRHITRKATEQGYPGLDWS